MDLQNTRIAVELERWNFLSFLGLKQLKKIPTGKFDSYTRILQVNPLFIPLHECFEITSLYMFLHDVAVNGKKILLNQLGELSFT